MRQGRQNRYRRIAPPRQETDRKKVSWGTGFAAGPATDVPKPRHPKEAQSLGRSSRDLGRRTRVRAAMREQPGKNGRMNAQTLGWITNFIWGIADDVLRDVYVRGKYRDVILPMVVIRRLDAVLEPTKQAVLAMKENLDKAGVANQDAALAPGVGAGVLQCVTIHAAGPEVEGQGPATPGGLRRRISMVSRQTSRRSSTSSSSAIRFLRSSRPTFSAALSRSFSTARSICAPQPVLNADGTERIPALDNHAMGTIFEELIRRFNEENNEEAGEHFTPRDVVKLMAELIFLPDRRPNRVRHLPCL